MSQSEHRALIFVAKQPNENKIGQMKQCISKTNKSPLIKTYLNSKKTAFEGGV